MDQGKEAPSRGGHLADSSELLIEGLVRLCGAVVFDLPFECEGSIIP